MLALLIGAFMLSTICAQAPDNSSEPIVPISCMKPKPPKGWKFSDCKRENKADAVSAGLDSQGNEIYIGRGLFDGYFTPGRITFEALAGKKAGLCIELNRVERCKSTRIEYLVRNPNCDYKWVPSSDGAVVKSAKSVFSVQGGITYYIGRALIDGSYQIGKVYVGKKLFIAPNLEADSYEVLVLNCKPAPCKPVPTLAPPKSTVAPPTSTVAPPTTTAAQATTTGSPTKSCTLNCSDISYSILDDVGCRCCEFAEFPRYEALQSQLTSLLDQLSAQTIDAVLQSKIDALKSNIADIERVVIGSCGMAPPDSIIGFLEFGEANLQTLSVSVANFDFQFNPSKCRLKCDEANGFVPVYRKCQCVYLEGYATIVKFEAQYNKLLNLILRTLYDSVTYYEKLEAYQFEYNYYWEVRSSFQWNWNASSLEAKMFNMTEVERRMTAINVTITSYCSSGICGSACKYFSIPESTNGCACDGSETIIEFYNTFEQFLKVESEIKWAKFLNYTDEKTQFRAWIIDVRNLAVEFYQSISLRTISAEEKIALTNNFIAQFTMLKNEWELFKVKLIVVEKVCEITCTGDTVKQCDPCQCVAVSGWDNLLNVIYPDIDATLADIAALADGTNKDTLKSNTDTLKGGIDTIKAYVDDSSNCKGLDVASIQVACSKLTTQYSTTKADIITVQNSASSGTCSITCPSSNWVQTISPCSCKCLPFTCNASEQALDIYNCQCAAKSTCAETQSNCSAQGKILDYSECLCKPQPGAV